MDAREKIINVIDEWANKAVKANKFDGASVYNPHNAAELADALIAANIGDVTAWKERAEKHRVIALPGGRIKQLYSDEEVEQIVKERDEYKHRAEVAEKERDEYRKSTHIALRGIEIMKRNIIRVSCADFPSILQQAEKELAEERKDEQS